MRTTHDVFHLAIPVHDLDAAQSFYVRQRRSRRDRGPVDSFAGR